MSPPPVSVVILRELDAQATGGECCGSLDGGSEPGGGARAFPDRRRAMVGAGALAQALRAEFGTGVAVVQVDPRNPFGVWAVLLGVCLRARRGWRAWLRVLTLSVRVPSVFVDGEPIPAGAWPPVAEVGAAIRAGHRGEAQADAAVGCRQNRLASKEL